MGLKETLGHLVGTVYFNGPARKLTLAQHTDLLRRTGTADSAKLASARGTEYERKQLRHVIGIERWSQRRLKVFLGEPFVLDGHREYKPPADAAWEQMRQDFGRMRAETVALAEQITAREPDTRVEHNQFGPLTARGWLRYIEKHSEYELRKFK